MVSKRFFTAFAVCIMVAFSAAPLSGKSKTAVADDGFQSIERERVSKRDSILSLITGAEIDAREVLVTKFGAKGDGKTDCGPAFDKAMKYASKKGGAHIIVPEGTWFVKGPIHFVSNVCLDIQENAVLLFSSEPSDYLPVVNTSWESTFLYNYSPFIYGYGLHDVSIVGKGTIDGNAAETFATWSSQERESQALTRKMNHEEAPVENRVFGEGQLLRPQFIQFYDCKNITVEGVHLTNSPFWCVHLLKCENIICRGLRYDTERVNNDGIDPEYSRNVLIEDIDFNNGDDDIAIKSGRDNDGRTTAIPSENIVIRNCRFKGVSGVAVGSEMSGGVQNVFIENCTFNGYCRYGIYLKTNPNRGGYIRNIYVNNCEFDEVGRLFQIQTAYNTSNEVFGDRHFAKIENIYVNGLRCCKADKGGLVLQGTKESPIKNVFFKNVEIAEVVNAELFENAMNVEMTDCHMGYIREIRPYSLKMMLSEMLRNPQAANFSQDGRPWKIKWEYTTGLELMSFLAAAEHYKLDYPVDYVKEWADTIADENGNIQTYKREAYKVDHVSPARVFYGLYDRYPSTKTYREVIETIYGQLRNHPRTLSGEFWHSITLPHQVWMDGLYMALPFYTEYVRRFAKEDEKDAMYDDIVHQFKEGARNTYDPVTGLYRHAWDESKSMFWADPETGQSKHAWGRANGWYAMALVDALDNIEGKDRRDVLIGQLEQLLTALKNYADKETGMWWQVLDCPGREGNYLESSSSIMFIYATLKAANRGWLSEEWKEYGLDLYRKFIRQFVREDECGTISITSCCAVATLGGRRRNAGDFAYYLTERIIENDCKVVGSFILASLEYESATNVDYIYDGKCVRNGKFVVEDVPNLVR